MKKQCDTEIYELTCDTCGKIITSLSEQQADYNMKIHKMTHAKKKRAKNEQGRTIPN